MVEEKVASPDLQQPETPPSTEETAPTETESPEPTEVLTPEVRERIAQEAISQFVESETFLEHEKVKPLVQSQADKRVKTYQDREREIRETATREAEQRVRAEYERRDMDARVKWLTGLEPSEFHEAMKDPANKRAWAGTDEARVDEAQLLQRGAASAFEGIKAEFRRLRFAGMSDEDWATLERRADSEAKSQAEWFAVFNKAADELRAQKLDKKDDKEAREAIEAETKAKLRTRQGPEDVEGGGAKGKLTPEKYKKMSDEERARLSPEEIDAMTTREYLAKP